MRNNKNIFTLLFATLIFGLFFISLPVFALEYTPLAPFNEEIGTGSINLADYLQQMFQFIIGISAILAILMIVIGGVQYMMSDVVTDKSDAKKRIWSAITGLILAILSIFILGIVNKNILITDLLKGTPTNPTEIPSTPEGTQVIIDIRQNSRNYCIDYYNPPDGNPEITCEDTFNDCVDSQETIENDTNSAILQSCYRTDGNNLEFCYKRTLNNIPNLICNFSTLDVCISQQTWENNNIRNASFVSCREKLEFGVE